MIEDLDKEIIRMLQGDIPITATPYKEIAKTLNIDEDELLYKVKTYTKWGILKRIGAILYHRNAGFNANAMVVWKIDNQNLDHIGDYISSVSQVSHCYERKPCTSWDFNFYTMIHEHDKESCDKIIKKIASNIGCTNYKILYSTKEFKKTSMKYFK